MGKHKHLSLSDRIFIEHALSAGMSLKAMAEELEKDPTTISKEIRRNRIHTPFKQPSKFVRCEHYKHCNKMNLCAGTCTGRCSRCSHKNCYKICALYTPQSCARTKRMPYVCNGCTKNVGCLNIRYHYRAISAHSIYRDTLSSCRKGIDMTESELENLDNLVSPLIKRGQPLAHIFAAHKAEITCSQRTLYNYIDQKLLVARNLDLPRKVRYKKRKRARSVGVIDQQYLKGRRYEDFQAFMRKHPKTNVVEMDTVHGRIGGKVLLTLFFRNSSLMLAFLMPSASEECVNGVFDKVKEQLGSELFRETFPLLLTDNGPEFKAPEGIEFDADGRRYTRVFFCDPYKSNQKARLEKNHEFIRYVLPKGKSFDHLTQENIDLLVNNINSIARASLDGNTPFQLASSLLAPKVLDAFGLYALFSDEVLLKPSLLN